MGDTAQHQTCYRFLFGWQSTPLTPTSKPQVTVCFLPDAIILTERRHLSKGLNSVGGVQLVAYARCKLPTGIQRGTSAPSLPSRHQPHHPASTLGPTIPQVEHGAGQPGGFSRAADAADTVCPSACGELAVRSEKRIEHVCLRGKGKHVVSSCRLWP